jgi:hypothetical protein
VRDLNLNEHSQPLVEGLLSMIYKLELAEIVKRKGNGNESAQ